MKKCIACHEEKPLKAFYFRRRQGSVFPRCMECHKAYMKKRYIEKRVVILAKANARRQARIAAREVVSA